jgi:hypothetical protein
LSPKGEYQAKEPIMPKYLAKVRDALVGLSKFEIRHILRKENGQADLLFKLASTKKASNYHSVVEEVIPHPSLTLQVQEADWRTPLIDYIDRGITPEGKKESKQMIKKATRFEEIEGHLFKNGTSTPLLKCIGSEEVWYVLAKDTRRKLWTSYRGQIFGQESIKGRKMQLITLKNVNSVNDMLISFTSCQKNCTFSLRHGHSTHGGWTSWDLSIKPQGN